MKIFGKLTANKNITSKDKIHLFVYLVCGILLSVLIFLSFKHIEITQIDSIKRDNLGNRYIIHKTTQSMHKYTVIVKKRAFCDNYIKIYPDDIIYSINLNGEEIDLSTIKNIQNTNFYYGKKIKLPFIHGNNILNIYIKNRGGPTGISINNSITNFKIIIIILLLINIALLILKISKYYKIDKLFILIFLLSIFLKIAYFSYTNPNLREYDYFGHLNYISEISLKNSIPKDTDCWECYHPPLYYLIASFFYPNQSTLQILSIIFSCFTTFFMMLTIKKIFLEIDYSRFIPLSFIALWPSSIINSTRIGNDNLMFMFLSISIYFATIFWYNKNFKNLTLALIFALLSSITKLNGILAFGVIFLEIFLIFLKTKSFRNFAKYFLLGFLMFMTSISPNIYKKIVLKDSNIVSNIICLNSKLKLTTSIYHLFFFSPEKFIKNSYIDPWEGDERNLFLNYLFKSSITGEFIEFSSPYIRTIIYFLFVIFLFFTTVTALFYNKNDLIKLAIPLIIFSVSMILVYFFRIQYPYSCSQDFRYIFIAILGFIPIFMYSFYKILKTDFLVLKVLMYSSIYLFLFSIIFYFVNPVFF